MTNSIKITQCDNELIIFAVDEAASDCYEICNIKSGNTNSVDVTIDLQAGTSASETIDLNGVNGPIHEQKSFDLPIGKYTLLYSGLNWGGPYNFEFDFKGAKYSLENNSTKPLFGVIWNRGNDEIKFEVS